MLAIVGGASSRVAKHLERHVQLCHRYIGSFRPEVRMIPARKLPVALCDLLLCCVCGKSEEVVQGRLWR